MSTSNWQHDLGALREQIVDLQQKHALDLSEMLDRVDRLDSSKAPSPVLDSPGVYGDKRFQTMFETSPLGIMILADTGAFLDVNPAMTNILGYSKEEFLGLTALEVTHPDYLVEHCLLIKRMFKGEISDFQQEKRCLHKNGEYLWTQFTATVVRDEEGKALYGIGMLENVTERKEALDAIRKSEQLLNGINQNIREGIYRSNPKGIIYANDAFVRMFGYSSLEEVLTTSSAIWYDDPEHRQRLVDLIIEDGKFINEEVVFRKKDGVRFYGLVSATIHKNEDGTPYFDGAIRDITEEKKMEREAKESFQLLSSISSNIEEGIYRSTMGEGLTYVNKAFASMFGYDSLEEVLERPTDHFYYDADDRNRLFNLIVEQGSVINQEVRYRKKDGSMFWGLLSARFMRTDSGTDYFDGAIRDVSIQKRAQEQLQEAKNQAEEMNRMKSNFLANMSHEVRTPINGIIGLAEVIELEFENIQGLNEYTSLLKESGNRLLNTITSILELSKIEAQSVPVRLSNVNFDREMQQVLGPLRILADKKDISLQYENKCKDVQVKIDVYVLGQIINNLVGNAIKFTKEGGVTIEVACQSKRNKRWMHCRISDTGIGISSDFMPHLFSSFAQESRGIGRKFEGSGLGLSIVKRYLELFGGSIQVDSEKNRGSTFEFKLPAV